MNAFYSMTITRARSAVLLGAVLCASAVLLSACGGDSKSTSGSTGPGSSAQTPPAQGASTPAGGSAPSGASTPANTKAVLHCAP
ncbi:hypothetical protein [Paraburkholderia megapolitana]|uniref:Uncharacterized protein n=1 Tax=Paraburkholderia megapolitana TaxID=420953 RepID=A0A1I3E5N4_9BURK|nr:hypothetical protein [Paraburkholderia megapolitana]SFH94256.1 hypothetical protein SAMN05192543_101697 [Paraburkholderia megapolitana]